MKSLTNQHWTSLSGEPITGRIPPTLRIMNGVEPTPLQMGEIAHHYKLMTHALKVSIIPYMVQERTLVDGTRVRMVSSYGVDTVMVWPAGAKKNSFELPHGFVVVTPYSVPRIYMRNKATNTWSFSDRSVPQAKSNIVSTNQVYQTVQGGLPIIMPMVLGSDKFLWDWAAHKTETGGSGPAPINLEIQKPGAAKKRAFHPTHFAGGGAVTNEKGGELFRMPDSPTTWNPAEEAELLHLPPMTDGVGRLLALQSYREKPWFDTGYVDIQHQHDILKRTGGEEYMQVGPHYVESFRVPAWAPTTSTIDRSSSDLDDAVPDHEKIQLRQINSTGTMGGPGSAGTFVVAYFNGAYWAPLSVRTYFGVVGYTDTEMAKPNIIDSMTGMTYERRHEVATGGPPICVAVLPTADAVQMALITNEIAYPSHEYMRGGSAFSSTGWEPGYFQYGTEAVFIDRRDSRYERTGTPKLTLSVQGSPWPGQYRLFEGTVDGELTGKFVTDKEYRKRSTDLNIWTGYNLLSGTSQPSWSPKSEMDYFGQTADFHLDWEAEILSRDNKAAFAEILNTPVGWFTTLDTKDLPSVYGEYTFTSRFIIDFDSRARFLAAIIVEVVCDGAQWGQNVDSSYHGALELVADPTYTATIRFESDWDGVKASKVLATATCMRPAFEFSTIRRENPYIYPAYDPTKDLIIRMPPDISPAPESYHQIKNLVGGQGVNTHLAAADVMPPLTVDGKSDRSDKGIEFSAMKDGEEVPHRKYVTGQLYVRQFKLSDFQDAMWLLHSTACDAPENNFSGPLDGSDPRPAWFYMPELGETIKSEAFRIEMRDGQIVDWTDAISAKPGSVKPAPNDRDIKLYRV